MCGLVGVITQEKAYGAVQRAKYMRQALIIDTLRGEDSTGIFLVPHDNPIGQTADWYKRTGDGYAFTESKGYCERMVDVTQYAFMVGHNRAATQGAVNATNAHPFEEGPITMVHNGTLRDDTEMPKSMAQLGVEVDSHAICHNLAEQPNTPEGVQEVVKGLDGAFALIWHDARDNTLNIVRNTERPLHFVQDRVNKTIYFASEAEMLALLVKRLKINAHEECHYPDSGLYMKFRMDNVLEPEVTQMSLHVPKYGAYGNWNGTWAGHWDEGYGKGSTSPAGKQPPSTGGAKRASVNANRVLLGGMLRQVPLLMRQYMASKGYSIKDRYEFIPFAIQSKDKDNVLRSWCVYGAIGGRTKVTARIVNMVWKPDPTAMDRSWTVRPIGVSEDAKGKIVLICKMEATIWRETDYYCEAEEEEPTQGPATDYYPLFNNCYVSATTWINLTRDGCKACGDKPPIDEAWDLDWINDDEYICLSCQVSYDDNLKGIA